MLLTRRMEFSASYPRSASGATHGHNYVLEVRFRARNPRTGMVIDLKQLKDVMNRE